MFTEGNIYFGNTPFIWNRSSISKTAAVVLAFGCLEGYSVLFKKKKKKDEGIWGILKEMGHIYSCCNLFVKG